MPIDFPSSVAEGQDGMNFANILRACLSSGVLVVDDRQKISTLTPPAEQIMGIKASQALHHSMDLLPVPLQSIIRETFATKNPIVGRELLLHPEERGGITVQVNSALSADGNGKVSGVVVTLNDISSARKWESAMRRLDRLHSVGTLSASMAHEVKNAFVAIKTFVDLLLEKNQQADLAEIVRLEMGRIDSIIGQMLKFSGPAKPAFTHIRLHPVLDKSLQLIRHLLDEKKIKVIRAFAASPDLLEADSDQLEQAFVNLFFNALDAMGKNGRLAVSTELLPPGTKIAGLTQGKSKPLLRIVIQDSGIGIASENMDRLFEPFFTTKPDGTGLGLAITRRIIQEHRGVITVQSESEKGTAFSLVLPASNIKS
jgi:two-component system, NtrC family, sensor histidine kinase AtoS